MAEEPEENVDTPEADAPSETPGDPSASEAAPASDDQTPEPAADEAAPADAPAAEAAPAAPAEPQAPVTPKERRQRARAAKAAQVPTRPQMSPEGRQAERVAERGRKAAVRSARRKREREKARARRGADGAQELLAPRREQHPGQQKTRQGIVVSDRASKTIVVRIDVARRHRSYEKVVRTSTTLHAHDEREDAHIGDTVVVRESRPLSRTKRWRLVEVVERAK
jgi:small subunit ribosomal protein S17